MPKLSRSRVAAAAAAAAMALSLPGCGMRTGVAPGAAGVDARTIKVGMRLDLSGPLAGSGKTVQQASKLAAEEINAAGGVCGRRLRLVTRDNGYDPQKAITAYDDVKPEVLGFLNIYGSAVISALRDKIEQDGVLAGLTSFSSDLLGDRNLIVLGATYDVQMINAVDWLVRRGSIRSGDTVGHIYLQGDFGENSYKGSRAAAARLGLRLVGQQIKPTDADLTSQVNALRSAGARAVLIDANSKQTASAASVMRATGFDVPIMGGVSTFGRSLLSTSAAAALAGRYHKVSGLGSIGGTSEGARALAAAWARRFGSVLPESDHGVVHAYVLTRLYAKIIGSTCGDLTRKGLLDARSKITDFSVPGLLPAQNLADPSAPTSRESQIQKIDPRGPAGLSVLEDFRASGAAQAYQVEHAD